MDDLITVRSYRLSAWVYTQGGATYLLDGDVISNTVSRSLANSAGSFVIVLSARRLDGSANTWFNLLHPMDYVEVWAQDTAEITTGLLRVSPPILMRGFIDSVQRQFGTSSDGKPVEQITVQGRDFGKLFLNHTPVLGYEIDYIAGVDPLYTVITALGTNFQTDYDIGTLFTLLIENTIGQDIARMQKNNPAIPSMTITTGASLANFRTYVLSLQGDTGPVWNILTYFASLPFGEMFINEGTNAPNFNIRFTPYKALGGKLASDYAEDPGSVPLSLKRVGEYSIGKSDAEKITLAFAYPQLDLAAGDPVAYKAMGTPGENPIFDIDAINVFGLRRAEIACIWLGVPAQIDANDATNQSHDAMDTAKGLARFIWDTQSDFDLLEGGTLQVIGDARFDPGLYVLIEETGYEYYIQSVEHTYGVQPGWITTLEVIRGQKIV